MMIGGRLCFALLALALTGGSATAQSGRTVKLVVPAAPGASTDFVARLSADHMSRVQGVTAVVENRAGANGMIGVEAVSRAAPDGNTLLVTANTYLLDDLLRMFPLVRARGRTGVDRLAHPILKLLEVERAVIQRARQAEPIVHERELSRTVTVVHTADLRQRHVRLVDHYEKVFREIIEQACRPLTFRPPR